MTYLTGTVTGKLLDASGSPLVGTVTFTPEVRGPILDASQSLVVPSSPVTVTLDGTGAFSVVLAATDDPGLNPTGFTYRVQVAAPTLRGVWFDPYSISVPHGVTTDLSTVTPVASTGGAPTIVGPQGIQGPAGPAVGDGTVAGYVNTPGSATDTALKSGYISGTSPTYSQQQTLGTTNAMALQRFRAALANRANTRCNMFHLGDSVTYGYRGTTTPTMGSRWTQILAGDMRTRYPVAGVTGGLGWVPAGQGSGLGGTLMSDAPLTYNPASPTYYNSANGLNLGAFYLVSGQTATLSFTGTGVDILYHRHPGNGTFGYSVDGGAITQVNTNGAEGEIVIQIRGLSVAAHNVVISWVSDYAEFSGFYCYNGDESAGIGTYNLGWTGIASDSWADSTKGKDWPAGMVALGKCDLLTIELGLNDQTDTNPLISSAQFQTNLTTIINRVTTAYGYTPSTVLIPTWEGNYGGTYPEPLSNYVNAMYAVAAANPTNVCVFDARKRVSTIANPTASSTNGILHTDNKHLSALGNTFFADSLADFISPK